MPKFIRFKDELFQSKLSPQKLITYRINRYHGSKRYDIFRTYPKKVIERIERAYGIKSKIFFRNSLLYDENILVFIQVEFEELFISEMVYTSSNRKAWSEISYKIYKNYCSKLIG